MSVKVSVGVGEQSDRRLLERRRKTGSHRKVAERDLEARTAGWPLDDASELHDDEIDAEPAPHWAW